MPRFRILALALLASCSTLPPAPFTEHRLSLKALTTANYQEYDWTQKDIAFSIALPTGWKVSYSVILDEKGRKTAEFSPGFVQGPAEVFDLLPEKGRVFSGPDSKSTVLGKERVSVGGRRAVRVTETALATGGPAAPEQVTVDVYYVPLPKFTFVMSFQYSTPLPEETVRRILQSVRISELGS